MIRHPVNNDIVVDVWPNIFDWLKFFNGLVDVNHPVLRDDVLKVLGIALCIFASPTSSIVHQVVTTSGVMELAASMWLKESDHRMPTGSSVCSAAVYVLLSHDHDGDMLDEFVQHTGSSTSSRKIANIAVSRLRRAIPNAVPPMCDIDGYISVMSALSRNTILCFSILKSAGIPTVIDVLTKLAGLHNLHCKEKPESGAVRSNEVEYRIYRVMEACCSYLTRVIEAGNGLTWVQQAVRNGLLDLSIGFARTNAHMPASLQELFLELVATIAPYFFYRSVFSLCTTSYSDHPAIWKALPNSSLKSSLEKVYRRAAHHTQLAQHWDAFKDIAHCDNCEKNDSKRTLKWCAGCRSVFYCSKECQKTHWETIHRFHLERLRATVSSSEPLSDIGVSINYTDGEPFYCTFSLKHYTDNIADELNDAERVDLMNGIIEQARSDKGRTSLIESIVALGECTKIFFTLVAPPIWDAQDGRLNALDFRIVNAAALDDNTSTSSDEESWSDGGGEDEEEGDGDECDEP
ncbi:hypothetical protein FA95DRAFT_1596329 [Auriscalpium vulgare]|uniref:Uncharacterized protein n=1 Tax=Auriscalpium vulgare TaxID=40419 RepID=A0ACB8RRK1_9AGAM|nr:hypothetical protein FA95DRAFT_1596329 [Auriscalpium vulgare]